MGKQVSRLSEAEDFVCLGVIFSDLGRSPANARTGILLTTCKISARIMLSHRIRSGVYMYTNYEQSLCFLSPSSEKQNKALVETACGKSAFFRFGLRRKRLCSLILFYIFHLFKLELRKATAKLKRWSKLALIENPVSSTQRKSAFFTPRKSVFSIPRDPRTSSRVQLLMPFQIFTIFLKSY